MIVSKNIKLLSHWGSFLSILQCPRNSGLPGKGPAPPWLVSETYLHSTQNSV